jgi:hypothetical protein
MKSSLIAIVLGGLAVRLAVIGAGSVEFFGNWTEFSTPADSHVTRKAVSFQFLLWLFHVCACSLFRT